ncbi:MAG: ABC transporter ATP-binding protein [Streptococcus parasanguinis]|uniref:ATP-binding cassette domain-containing protein n=1 Tax=Streptococcus parasanguinis TaxID=1318 RepID=UPI00066AFBDF|nr:ABC transporter ATP-binding protein [Streptococcus parasanguinis]MDU6758227.1 ABC transporter ATP-binding protein [Streptococcus parasanguinis]
MTIVDLLKKIHFYISFKERVLWGIGVVLASVSAIVGLLLPAQINLLFQNFKEFNYNRMVPLALLFLIQNAIMYFSLYILGKVGEHTILSLRKESVLSLLNSEIFNLETTTWASRVIYNPGFFSDLISRQIPTLIINTLQLSLSIIILFYLNLKITLFIIIGILVVVTYSILSGKILSKIQIRFQNFLSTTNQQLSDVLGRLGLIRINNTFDKEFKDLKISIQEIFKISVNTLKISIFSQIGNQLLFILISISLLFIIMNDIKRGVTQMSSVTLYIMYCAQLLAPLLAISDDLTSIKRSKEVMVEYLNTFSDLESNSNNCVFVKFGKNTQIEIINYLNPFNKKIISNLNFYEGEVYQLTGSSGIGKTTLLNSILGLVKFNTGQIHLTFKNGKTLYSKLAYYQSQQQILVNKTIRDNLSYSHQIPDEELIDTLQKFGLFDEFHNKDLLNLIVTEKTLSKGQIARLALAREYLKEDSEIVILDEPYAHIDEVNSRKIDEMFRDRFKNSILIIVSHTKNYINKKDYIIEMV